QKKSVHSEDPFNDEQRERHEVEMLAKKFEAKYGGKPHKHRKDRLQDLIDIGYGYDETDPFIDNSEAYDELVPASLTTKYGGFYINTGTLQFRQASDSEDEDFADDKKHRPPKVTKLKESEDRGMKKRKRKDEEAEKEKKPRKMKVPKQLGVMALNSHKSEKKKKKLYKDSLSLAAMIRKFQKEKEAMRKKESSPKPPVTIATSTPSKVPSSLSAGNDISDLNLRINDPVLSIFGSTNERELLQEAESALEMLGDIDFDKLLDGTSDGSPVSELSGENGNVTQATYTSQVLTPKQVPALPEGLPMLLEKRIGDLRTAAKMFDEEGRKKFFTQDMNNILLDIELQLQEINPAIRNGVYSHLEAFVPCNKDTLIKRLKKLHLNVQDDRLREPLQKLKLAVSNVMPEQLCKYQEDCQARNQAKNAKLQAEDEREKNGSEEDDDEKPGKRVVGPRKKFHWDDTVRSLLCNLVKIKLGCYELEPNRSQSAEDYLKTFMETEVKPLWPKGWMQARMLFKESRSVHNHLTSAPAKKKVILAPKSKAKVNATCFHSFLFFSPLSSQDSSPKKEQKTCMSSVNSGCAAALSSSTPTCTPVSSSCTPAPETICLDDSLDEDLSFHPPSLDSISDALAVINNGAKGSPLGPTVETPPSRPRPGLREEKLASIMSKLPLATSKKVEPVQTPHSSSLIAGHTGPVPKKPQDLVHTGISSGLIAGSSIQNPKVSLEPLPAKLLQQGLQRSSQIQAASSSSQTHVSSSKTQAAISTSSQRPKEANILVSSSEAQSGSSSTSQMTKVHQHSAVQQKYVSPLQATISKSQTNPVVKLSSNPKLSCSSPVLKSQDKSVVYRLPLPNTSSGSSSQVSHPLVSRTTSSTSTSSNYLAKAMVSQVSSQGFKPPFSMAASPKPAASPKSTASKPSVTPKPNASPKFSSKSTSSPRPATTPSSSSSSALASQSSHSSSNPLHKQTSGVNISRQSPTVNLLPSNRTSGLQPAKNPQASSKLSNSSPSGTVGKNNLGGVGMNVPASRGSNLNSSGASRTSLSGGAGSGTQGATKQLSTPHRPSSASGSPVVAASVQSTAGASLLANASPLTLMASPLSVTSQNVTSAPLAPFGMLGGLVPVTVPFQFPLELLGFGTDTAGVTTTSGSTSAAFHHSLTQNLLKGLQPGAQHAATLSHSPLPAHLQQAYTDGGQSKGDTKVQRKNQ
ncbi:UBN2 protein, partial [Eudromia elegans]|nr:UBN2 protein [Eudromia elegans]